MRGLPLADGSLIMLVVGHVTTPCGRVIQRQYRGITRRDYFRLARAERDTAGSPSAQTDRGRNRDGGGGGFSPPPSSRAPPARPSVRPPRADRPPPPRGGGVAP